MAKAVLDAETGQLLAYQHLMKDPKYHEAWATSSANDFRQLAQGVGRRDSGIDTIFFIHKNETHRNDGKTSSK